MNDRGRVIDGEEAIDHCKRHGLCVRCGKRQTHEKVGPPWNARLRPIYLKRDERDKIIVYRGYCISPTCYSSVEQVDAIESGQIMDSPIARPGMHRPTLVSPVSASSHSSRSTRSTRTQLLGSLSPPGLYQSNSVPMPSISHDRPHSSRRVSDGNPRVRNTSVTSTTTSSSGGSTDNETNDFGGPTSSQVGSSFTTDNSSSRHSRSIQSSMIGGSFTTTGSQRTSSSWRQQQEQLLQNLGSGSGRTAETEESNEQQQNMQSLSSSGRSQSSQSAAIAELQSLIVQGEYIRFFNDLNDKGADKTVALEGFKLLRYHFVEKQKEGGFVLYEDWTKTTHDRMIMIRGQSGGGGRTSSSSSNMSDDERETVDGLHNSSCLSSSSSDKDVVMSGLLVFLTLSTLNSGSFRRNMVEKGSVKLALEYLTTFKGDKDICDTATALFLSLSMKLDKHGLNVRFDGIRILMQRLVRLVCNGEYGRDCALRALYYMSHQKKPKGEERRSLSHQLKALFGSSDQNISGLVNILKEPNLRQRTAESVLSLLWRMSIPSDNQQNEDLIPLSEELVLSLARLMNDFDSITIRESCCGILCNLSMRNGFPFESALPCFDAIHGFLTGSNVMDEGLAISSSHAIRNMLVADSCRKVLMSDNRILDTIISLLRQHSSSAEIVEYCCLALAHAGRNDYSVKDTIVQLGGFDLVKQAFVDFAIEGSGDNPSLIVKDASLCAMATISSCRSGNQAIREGGFFETLQTLLEVEVDRDFETNLAVIIYNCQYDFSPDVSVERRETAVESPEQFASRVNEIDDPNSLALLFQGSGKATVDCGLSTLGFYAVIDAMARFVDSAIVQEHGCALLSELYFDPPVKNYDAAAYPPWSSDCLNAALETIHKAMGHHRREASVVINAYLAIINICSRFPEMRMDAREMIPALIDDVLEGLLYHSSHQPSVTIGTAALLALMDSAFLASIDLIRWADRTVHVLSDFILRFPSDTKILITVLDIFLRFLNKSLSISLMGSPPVIAYVCNLVSNNNAEVAGRASATLACLVHMNFASASFIMESSDAVKGLVFAMAERVDDLHIQINLCFVIASLINYGSDFAVHMQDCANVSLDATIKALTIHRNNPELIKHACCILASFFPVVNTESSSEMNDSALSILNAVMDQHVEDAKVESQVFDALCSLSRKNGDVKVSLAEENRLKTVFAIMGLHIGSVEVQRSGCSLLSVLCGHRPAKAMIGQEGIVAIVHALLAHNQSSAVQKEGLLALKSLATESGNKQHISTSGGDDAVVYSLWIHYRDPSVLSTGLSALNNISVDKDSRTVSEMREQVLMITIGAMARFCHVEQVQTNACFYLKSCSYLPANLQMMADHSEQLIPLLIQASETYPDQCKAKAHSIIEKISHL